MLNVSQAYQNLMQSTFRLKCEPTVTIKSKDGTEDLHIFKSSNMTNLKINRKIDVLGKELPTIEFEWSAFYTGQDYSQLMYSPVNVMFHQTLSATDTSNTTTWEGLYENYTWKSMYKNFTWRSMYKTHNTEDINFCTLFISEEPTIKENKITFKARDVLNFMNFKITDVFGGNLGNTYFYEPISKSLQKAIEDLPKTATALISKIETSGENIKRYFENLILDRKIEVSSSFKDFLRNYLSLKNAFIYFNSNGTLTARKFISSGYNITGYTLNGNLMFKKPTIQELSDVKIYENSYNYWDNVNSKWVKGTNRVLGSANGEIFTEKNPLWAYREEDFTESSPNVSRAKHIDTYYFGGAKTIEVECLPNLAIETGDIIKIEYQNISSDAIVVRSELAYNGALREKIYLHTMKGA